VILGPGAPGELELAGNTAVVIDVLRFTTTVNAALEAGAKAVYPVAEPEDAWRLQSQVVGEMLLGGERGGLRINGFDLGNSPREYRPEVVGGRLLAMTTTNGTAALLDAHRAGAVPIYVGSLRNAPAVARRLVREAMPVVLWCSGSHGEIALEDVVGAGAIVSGCMSAPRSVQLNDTAMVALAAFKQFRSDLKECPSHHCRKLLEIGFEADVDYASELGASDVIGEFDGVMIRPAGHALRRGAGAASG
jgi:2-phosphosulfolactate phosphatase